MAKRTCKGKTKAGKACGAAPLRDGDYCLAHSDQEVRDSVGFGGPQEGAGRPRLPRPHEVLRERIEADIDRWLAPLEAALGAGKPLLTWDQAEGKHSVEFVADPALGMKAMKLAFDRVYGKPRQALEHSGPDGGAIHVTEEQFADPTVRKTLDELVGQVAALRDDR